MSLNAVSEDGNKLERLLNVESIGVDKFIGQSILQKPDVESRGVFGGFICAQALIAAQETISNNYRPHSLHSYFISAGDDSMPFEYDVERVMDGKSFANRLVRVYQEARQRYIMMISFTTRNSSLASAGSQPSVQNNKTPVHYQSPLPSSFYKYKLEDLPTMNIDRTGYIEHRFPPEYFDLDLAPSEKAKKVTEREACIWMRVGDKKIESRDPKYRYAGIAIISDCLHLASLSRLYHLPIPGGIGISGGKGPHYFNVSLDHTIFFHDDNFDPYDWILCKIQTPKLTNDRVLVTMALYTKSGKQVATMVQEGLVYFHSGFETKAKF